MKRLKLTHKSPEEMPAQESRKPQSLELIEVEDEDDEDLQEEYEEEDEIDEDDDDEDEIDEDDEDDEDDEPEETKSKKKLSTKQKQKIFRVFFAFCFALSLMMVSKSGLFYKTAMETNDEFYQKTSMTSGDVCIIGIDGESIDTLGSFPFDRQVFADVLHILNGSDSPPIAIGMDVLFTGESNPDSDRAFVDAVAQWDNVVLACSGNYGTTLMEDTHGDVQLYASHLLSMNLPFPDLLEVSTLGHINSSLGEDGILREGILYITNQEGDILPSFALSLYQIYCRSKGIEVGDLPSNRWYLPFTATSGGYYDGYSLSRVLSGEIPPSVFANKIVMIGPYTVGLQDHFYTAIDHNNMMFGVEYQANALEILMNKQFISPISAGSQQIFLGTVLFLLFLVVFDKKYQTNSEFDKAFTYKVLLKNSILLFGVGLGYVLLCDFLYRQGYMADVFYLPLGCFLLFILSIVMNAYQESKNRAYITNTFKRYVAPEVVDNILEQGVDSLHLGGSLMHVSVMFIDVRNFTPMSEKFQDQPEILIEILNSLLDSMASTIMENGGTLDKFIGDAIMCFWGAPVQQEDHVYLSVKTAVEITENLEPIIENIKKRYNHDVSVGIGIQCGLAVAGNIGSLARSEYTVIGDTVNTAARLESNAKGGHNVILISHRVYREVMGRFQVEKVLGGLALKGKTGRLKAYRVLRELDWQNNVDMEDLNELDDLDDLNEYEED